MRVLINIQRDQWRKRSVRARLNKIVFRGSLAVGRRDVEAALIAKNAVWQALNVLPPRRRAIVVILSTLIFLLISVGGTIGGELTYDYGFNVETAGDSPVWAVSEVDVFPGQDSGS